jgi:hypothetical protein
MSAPANVFTQYSNNIFQFKNGKTTKIEITKTTVAKRGQDVQLIASFNFKPEFTVNKIELTRKEKNICQIVKSGPMTVEDSSLLLTFSTLKFYSEGTGYNFIAGNVTYVTNCLGLSELSQHDKVFVYFALFVISYDKGVQTFSFKEFKKALHSYRGVHQTSPVHAILVQVAELIIAKCKPFERKKFNNNKNKQLVACSESICLPDEPELEELVDPAAD